MSEKMDGIRGYWTGKKLLSNKGKTISCPLWFCASLPAQLMLDGELWMGKGTTAEDIMKIVNSKNGDWSLIGYHIFDIPSSSGTYEERMKDLENLKPILAVHIHIVKSVRCTSMEHLREYLEVTMRNRGEGLMLRQPHSAYVNGLTASLLKVKVTTDLQRAC
jgi:DNA ligase-1